MGLGCSQISQNNTQLAHYRIFLVSNNFSGNVIVGGLLQPSGSHA
jgi:hypothetical protein